jgi:hypothetical protein
MSDLGPSSGNYIRALTFISIQEALGCAHNIWGEQDMLDMKMIVRFEVDACVSTETSDDTKPSAKDAPVPAVDDLADALGSMNLFSAASTSSTYQHSPRGHTSPPRRAARGSLALGVLRQPAGLERALPATRTFADPSAASRCARARQVHGATRMASNRCWRRCRWCER